MIGPEQTVSEQMRERRRSGLIWIAVALILGVTLGATYRIDQRADDTNERLATSTAQVETLTGQVQKNGGIAESAKDAADEANRRLAAAGKPTVPVPTEAPISPAPEQQDDLTAQEAAAVRVIVADQISRQKVTITQAEITQIARIAAALVPKPKDGSTPTAAQLQPVVTATLAAYCVDDKCVGKTGTPGPQGAQGERGEQGPKVTDEELLAAATAALAAYCGLDSQPCKGDRGTDGDRGPAGVSVTDMDCIGSGDDSYWLIYLSSDTTKKVSGPCRIAPLLPTEPPSGDR
jgi:hypothetical protein